MPLVSSTLIVGIGSPHGDDQVGWQIAQRLGSLVGKSVDVRQARSPQDLLDWLEGYKNLIICDACQGAGQVGSYHHWSWPTNQLETIRTSGSHQVSLPVVLSLAAQLGRLPSKVQIWGVEIGQSQPGTPLSEIVSTGAETVIREIHRMLIESATTKEPQNA
ncbi:MAG: hydrogenase maturation protease [Planctomycetaceae bacterium]